MSFGLKNVGKTYQRIMSKLFKEEIEEMLEVYMDNIIIKTNKEELYDKNKNLTIVLVRVRQYNMRLNPEKAIYTLCWNALKGKNPHTTSLRYMKG